MNKFRLLLGICFFLSSPLVSAEGTSENKVIEELNQTELSPVLAMPEDRSVRPEFKNIHDQLKLIKSTPYSCSNKLIDQINNLSKNRGLLDSMHFYLGICKDLSGDTKGAIDEYEKSLRLKRSNTNAILRLAYLNAANKNYTRSLALSEEVLWLGYKPKDVPLYLSAVAHKELGETKEAQAMLDKLDLTNPNFTPSLVLRKNLILQEINQTSDPAKVKLLRDSYNRLLPKLISLDTQNRNYTLEYAKILLAQGHPIHSPNILNQGLSLTRKFSRQESKDTEAFLLLELQFLEKQGKSSEALEILTKLSELKPLSANLEFRRKEIFDKLNPKSEDE